MKERLRIYAAVVTLALGAAACGEKPTDATKEKTEQVVQEVCDMAKEGPDQSNEELASTAERLTALLVEYYSLNPDAATDDLLRAAHQACPESITMSAEEPLINT